MGLTRTTNLGLLLILALSSCGRIFDAQSFFVAAQVGTDGTTGVGTNDGSVPTGTPPVVDAPTPPPTPASSCPINCANGSVCKLGKHNFDFFPTEENNAVFTFLNTVDREGWYCDCPAGYTGLRCNRPYEICPLNANITSSKDAHFCFHGGSCIEGLTDGTHATIDDSQRFCDCKKSQHNGTPYFGKYCEIEGAVRCADDSEEYCTSQGQCKDDFRNKFTPCDCRVGHRGPHCEFMRGSVPDCTLTCGGTTLNTNGTVDNPKLGGVGKCMLGIKGFENARYEDFWSGHDGNYQYCKCPEGWFGDNCEIPGIQCGSAHCFNGGECLDSLNQNGETTYACDCRDAGHLGNSWAGQYCENPETSSCNGSGNVQHANGHLFCTNGGSCKDPNQPHLGCDCPKGKFGPSCEFHEPADAECSLTCQNGGQCRTGMKDTSLIEKLGKDIAGFDATHHSELFEHCVCPNNYFGIQCEHKLEICPGGDHVCLHGSKCTANNEGGSTGDLHYTCDCDSAFNSLEKYAGKFCQYSSTDICTKNGQPGMGKANFAFCVNNGQCKGKVEDREAPPGCTCPQGFHGDHCEYLEEKAEDQKGNFDGGWDDDGDYDGGYGGVGDDDENRPLNQLTPTKSYIPPLEREGVVVGLSSTVIVIVLIFFVVVARALLGGGSDTDKAADIQGALDEEEYSANDPNVTGIISSASADGSLEDIEVDDYVNNHKTILSDKELTDVQLV